MKLSKRFDLNKSQFELDFVDIDLEKDAPLFIDPYFLAQRNDPWSLSASSTIRSFFQYLVTLLHSKNIQKAKEIFSHLGEPNETCLGTSKGVPKGRGVGPVEEEKIFESIRKSRAVETGLVEHLEDCRIFIKGIDKDKISDIATNLIKSHLITYTQQQCRIWGIATQSSVPSGFVWDKRQKEWTNTYAEMLIVDDKKILLTPKAIVSYTLRYSAQQYHQHYVLNFLQHEHLKLNSVLVQRKKFKDGTEEKFVTKKSLMESEAPLDKEFLERFTADHPEVFQNFKKEMPKKVKAITNEEITGEDVTPVCQYLIDSLKSTYPGNPDAHKYHKLIMGILELLFYPQLISPQIEAEIHDGRKRIDIVFDNAAESGFFHQLPQTYSIPCPYIFVECKNYKQDVSNPELDQLSGRFSPNRGKFGIMVCRKIDDLTTFIKRCSDTYKDQRGTIIPLVDDDIIHLLTELMNNKKNTIEDLLRKRLREVAIN